MNAEKHIECVNKALVLMMQIEDFDTLDEQFDCVQALAKLKHELQKKIKKEETK